MAIRTEAITRLTKLFGVKEAVEVVRLAKKQDTLEARWRRRMSEEIGSITRELLKNAERTGRLNFSEVDFTDILMKQSFEVSAAGISSAQKLAPINTKRLAAVPAAKTPRTLKELRVWWDAYRKKGRVPPRQKLLAERLKKAYINKLQSVWEKYGEEFRSGETASRELATRKIIEGAVVVESRGRMIMETETTYYYNKVRREVYDESPDVTHYMFMAVRDQATTKWCVHKYVDGKRGRGGLIYAKNDPLLEKETPPVHWNCRSEILPMTMLNPTHRKLIEDESNSRRKHSCHPLPAGWTGR